MLASEILTSFCSRSRAARLGGARVEEGQLGEGGGAGGPNVGLCYGTAVLLPLEGGVGPGT